MSFKLFLITLVGKFVSFISQSFNLGAGGTWPGEIGLILDKTIIKRLTSGITKEIILVAGTNGKTTTAKMIRTILKKEFKNSIIIGNQSGANLLNGITSALIRSTDVLGRVKADYAVFEVDEATLPLALKEFNPKIVVCMNLFRDQLDRYGEIDLIADKWLQALRGLPKETTIILNADDPQVAYLKKGLKAKVLYFGLEDPTQFLSEMPHAADSIYCLSCGEKLQFKGVYFSHLGIWECKKCGEKRPEVTLSSWDWHLPGLYNRYNILAAVLVGKDLGVGAKKIKNALETFQPAFGRGEEFKIKNKHLKILLSKNPTGFNVIIKRVIEHKRRTVLLALNDQIPDGRDVSWIWDVDFEEMIKSVNYFFISGDRSYDLGLRLKYAGANKNQLVIIPDLQEAIMKALSKIQKDEVLPVLPTYSAMLNIRKILRGRKIL